MHFSSVYQGTVSHLFGIHEIIEVFSDFVMFVFVRVCVIMISWGGAQIKHEIY